MKKLMIAAAIVCAAAMSQAGSAKWNLYDAADPDTGMAYLFNSADFAFDTYGDIDDIVKSISDGKFATDYVANQANNKEIEDGGFQFSKAIDGISGSTTLWMIAVDDAANPTKVFVSTEEITKSIGGTGSQTFAWTYDDNTTSWTAVPEPTSGLLLLLGVAGLALRRRRA